MTLLDFIENKALVELQYQAPYMFLDEIDILFETNRWDGVLSGYCKCKSLDKSHPDARICYFTCFDERIEYAIGKVLTDKEPTGWWRRYALVELSDSEISTALERHEDFKRYVGTHCEYKNNEKQPGCVCSQQSQQVFYEKYPLPITKDERIAACHMHDNHEVIGWFEITY